MRHLRDICIALSLLWLGTVLLCALFASWIAPYPYDVQHRQHPFMPPNSEHWLGTDEFGRDLLSRLLYGARISIAVGLGVETVAVLIALVLGLTAGYFQRLWDTLIMRLTDAMFAFPDILLAILIAGISGPGVQGVFVALLVVSWPSMTRLVRGMTLVLREQEFVHSARSLGAPGIWIMRRHLLPHLVRSVIAAATVEIAGLILAESALSFIGLGVQPPYPSWGSMINTAREHMRSYPPLLVYPCLALSLTVISLTFVGEWLQQRWGTSVSRQRAA